MRHAVHNPVIVLSFFSIALASLAGCVSQPKASTPALPAAMLAFATFPDQLSGIAVSQGGRVFVSFPAWRDRPAYSVAEVRTDGSLLPYPDKSWNTAGAEEETRPEARFFSVQSLFLDANNVLWALDAPAPFSPHAHPKGAKLVGIDLASDRIKKVIDLGVVPRQGFLRRVCVDRWGTFAYISDAGTGALVVVDLDSGMSRRVLTEAPSTKAEPGMALTTGGKELRTDGGTSLRLNVDGVALDKQSDNLYYHALAARFLYRIRTSYLNDTTLSGEELATHVERLADTGPADGLAMDDGYNLYLTAPEEHGVKRYRVYDDSLVPVAHDDRVGWADSVSTSPGGILYLTDSQFNRLPYFNEGNDRRIPPYTLLRILMLGSTRP